jgi:hypothetical protein
MDDITSFSHRRLATILKDPNHPHHAAAKAERDRRNMQREGLSSFKNFDEATYTDSGWQKPKKDTMSDADAMKKAKDLAKKAVILTKSASAVGKPVKETKGAPKGYHFTRDGKLKKGDAGADGDGGAKLRSDPLDKQRSKIPPIPEKFANPAQQAAVMAKLKKSGKYDGKESFGRANLLSRLKSKGMDVDKMHSNNMKDADAAKKRSAAAEKDLASFRNKTGVTSESKDEKFEPHMMYDPKTGEGKMAKVEADHIKMKKMGYSHDKPKTEATIPDGQTVMTKSDPVKKNDMDKLAKIRKMLDREKKK